MIWEWTFIHIFFKSFVLSHGHKLYSIDNFIFINIFIAYKVLKNRFLRLLDDCIFFIIVPWYKSKWRAGRKKNILKIPTKMKTRFHISYERVFFPRVKWFLMVFLLTDYKNDVFILLPFYDHSVNHIANEFKALIFIAETTL